MTSSSRRLIRNTFVVLFSLTTLFLCSTIYLGIKYIQLKKTLGEQQIATSEEEFVVLIREVESLMEVPVDEVPSIATVSDPTLLRGHPFFQNAKIGDKVLIYHQAGRAILYDPIGKRVVDVAPIGANPNEEMVASETLEEVSSDGDGSLDESTQAQ